MSGQHVLNPVGSAAQWRLAPWFYRDGFVRQSVVEPGTQNAPASMIVAELRDTSPVPRRIAGPLLGAAPDLLAALVVAREFISTDRASLAECSTAPDGGMEPDDARAVAEYDAALRQIDHAIAKATRSAT